MTIAYYTYLVKFYGSNKCVIEQKVVGINQLEVKQYIVNVYGIEMSNIISVELIKDVLID